MLKKKKQKSKTEARKLVVSDVFYSMKGLLQPPPHPWELPTYLSPKLTLTLTSHLGKNVGLREG